MSRTRKVVLPIALLGGAFLVVVLLIMCSSTPPAVERPDFAPLVETRDVQPQPVQFVVRAHGSVSPRSESDLVPQVSGEVVEVSPALAAGGFFDQGQVLVRIDGTDYETALESARASVARSSSEYARAKKERDRQRTLADRSVASQSRIDDAENAFRVADATLREARARLGQAERDLERTELRAPYTGRVRSESVDVGQFVQRGAPIAKLYAVDFAEVRLPLPDRELAFLDLPLVPRATAAREQPGSDNATPELPAVRLHADFAGGSHTWMGKVVRTEGELDPQSRMLHVVAQVRDPYGLEAPDDSVPPLAVGLFVEAEILGRAVDRAYVLPRNALRDGDRVYVVDADGKLHFRDVEVLRVERETAIIGAGLSPGDRVCVSALAAAVDGMSVRARSAAESLAGPAPAPDAPSAPKAAGEVEEAPASDGAAAPARPQGAAS